MKVKKIVQKMGGPSKLSRKLKHNNPTTVSGWLNRKIIPASQIENVLKAAREENIILKATDFFSFLPEELYSNDNTEPDDKGAA